MWEAPEDLQEKHEKPKREEVTSRLKHISGGIILLMKHVGSIVKIWV
jgi:hypothetical protein